MIRRPPRSTRTYTLFPYTTLFRSDLDSFLIEITAEVLKQVDAKTGKPLVDLILDEAEQKGTGRWTVKSALDLGIPVTGIAEAVFARALSGSVAQRKATTGLSSGELGEKPKIGRAHVRTPVTTAHLVFRLLL